MSTDFEGKRETTKMAAQFYMDMTKYLLLLMAAFGLFGKELAGTIARPVIIIVALIGVISAAGRAQIFMDRLDQAEEEKKGERDRI
jgi:hypothetical protein